MPKTPNYSGIERRDAKPSISNGPSPDDGINLAAVLQIELPSDRLHALAILHITGRAIASGIPQDDSKAIECLRRALELEPQHAPSLCSLGFMRAEGRCVAQSDEEAFKLYKLAADQGHAGGQRNLGLHFMRGLGVPQSDNEAFKLFKLSADQGHAGGQSDLGWMYCYGRGVEKSDDEAFRLFKLSADQGHLEGQYNLACMYFNGRPVLKEETHPIKLLRLSAIQGHPEAVELLAHFEKEFASLKTRDSAKKHSILTNTTNFSEGAARTAADDLSDISEEKLVRVPFDLKESYRDALKDAAARHGMTMSEFLRRAAFAAMKDEAILTQAEKEETQYTQSLGPSRWTKSHE